MSELIERDHAMQLLLSAAVKARRGSGFTALVCGEAGIGKTALVTRFADRQGDCRVLWGGCEALFSPRPLGPLYDMAEHFGGRLRAMLGVEGQRAALFAALLAELQNAAVSTVMVLEDLHWADAATLDWVKFLARRIQRVPALLVLTYRDDELDARHPLRGVLGDLPSNTVVRVPLLPLSEAGVATLAGLSNRPIDGLFATTLGNPFFVAEVLRADGLPATVRDAVLARAARQPSGVRELIELAAIVPARIDASMVDAVLGPKPEDLVAALASGLLTADGRSYAFRHELARIAIEQALPAPVAVALHGKVLACLEQQNGGVAMTRLVHHATGACNVADVLKYAPRAADEAASHGAHREAAALYAIALAHAQGLAPAARAALLERRSYLCYLVDQMEDAIAARLSELAIWRALGEPLHEARALRWLSRLYWYVGRNQDAERFADDAVQLLEGMPANSELAWALSNRSQLHMLAGHTEQAVAWGTRAIDLATRQGDLEVLAHALNNVGTARAANGQAEGRSMLERSLQLALDNGYGEHVARAYANLTSQTVTSRDYPAAQRLIVESAAYFAGRDFDSWANYVLAWESRLDFEQGCWDAAASLALRLVDSTAVSPVVRIPALTVLARLRMRRGDPGATDALREATSLALQTGELQRLAPVAAAHAEFAWLRNDGAPADDVLATAYALARKNGDRRALGELGFWMRRLGLDIDTRLAVEAPHALLMAGQWQAAAHAWAQLGCPYERALALLEGGEAGAREALAVFEALGAAAAARRCREHLRAAGVRGVTRGPRAATSANPAGLTARELQILGLLAQSLSNAEIARRIVRSEKTIDHHISAILRKLGVRTRGEAAAMAERLGLVAQA